ncbi:hypothetical protein LEP1GSC185_0516 [Leptospira licerasiae serovar Varillal str. VAR 010]|uniref:Uncharacterized protein n=1 Tax=Leptospira licerasiae str. MMD4847 TaxID=1049971 RepID=A0ABP2RAT3_9LEPT|nr:hypothetical protein LEP1GSC185_0516 [Leptospira licerasiae serovar Varillal str. VAR 010]EJZ40475.1 hypothetical protein LEP1GSC178_1622 [Leptospira licerasiae str. MMD4847]
MATPDIVLEASKEIGSALLQAKNVEKMTKEMQNREIIVFLRCSV